MKTDFYLTTAFQTDPNLPLAVHFAGNEQCSPGHDFGPCVRNVYLIHYVAKGKGAYTINKKTYHLTAGDGFLIPPFVSAYYQADEEDPWEYYWIGFSGPNANLLVNRIQFVQDKLIFHYDDLHRMTELLGAMADTYEKDYNIYGLIGYLYLFFSLVTKNTLDSSIWYVKLTEYIHANYMNAIDMQQLCDHVNLSRSQVYRLFMKYANQSPKEYLLNFRLDRAQELLSGSEQSITEIACACGFNNSSYFSNAFKDRTGSSPRQYRSTAKLRETSAKV